jgi:predicted ribosomally synthesized peptide with SipW-like signal peptide
MEVRQPARTVVSDSESTGLPRNLNPSTKGLRMFKKTRILLCGGALTSLVWAGTYATFTDSGTAESTFTAGTVDLLLSAETDDAYGFTAIEMANMKPGDVRYAPLTIANDGSLGFTYTMATSATNADTKALRDQLTLGVKKVSTAATCDSAGVGYAASLDTMTASGALSAGAVASRSLAAGASEVACFRVELPSTANDSFQGATTTATFTFSATQS